MRGISHKVLQFGGPPVVLLVTQVFGVAVLPTAGWLRWPGILDGVFVAVVTLFHLLVVANRYEHGFSDGKAAGYAEGHDAGRDQHRLECRHARPDRAALVARQALGYAQGYAFAIGMCAEILNARWMGVVNHSKVEDT